MGKKLVMKSNFYLIGVIALTKILMQNVECKLNKKNKIKGSVCVQIIGVLQKELLSYFTLRFVLKSRAT